MSNWKKLLNYTLDFLMFVVPVLELSQVVTLISPEYLPYYMIATVVLRRLVRVLEDYLGRNSA